MSDADQDAIDAIELALSTLGCSQKELAVRLQVSPTQISKWKKGEYMSSEMEDRIKEQSWPRLSEQKFRVDKWSLCRG